jgi:hypothetical protein
MLARALVWNVDILKDIQQQALSFSGYTEKSVYDVVQGYYRKRITDY